MYHIYIWLLQLCGTRILTDTTINLVIIYSSLLRYAMNNWQQYLKAQTNGKPLCFVWRIEFSPSVYTNHLHKVRSIVKELSNGYPFGGFPHTVHFHVLITHKSIVFLFFSAQNRKYNYNSSDILNIPYESLNEICLRLINKLIVSDSCI